MKNNSESMMNMSVGRYNKLHAVTFMRKPASELLMVTKDNKEREVFGNYAKFYISKVVQTLISIFQ